MRGSKEHSHRAALIVWAALPALTLLRRRHDAPTPLAVDGPEVEGPYDVFAELGCRPPEDLVSLRH
jgi:hypothetical protein